MPDVDIKPTSFKTLLESLETEPPLEEEVTASEPPSGEPSTAAASNEKSRALAKRLKDAFCSAVQKTTLPDPLSDILGAVAIGEGFVLGKTIRRNTNGDVFVDLYSNTTPSAPVPNGVSGAAGK